MASCDTLCAVLGGAVDSSYLRRDPRDSVHGELHRAFLQDLSPGQPAPPVLSPAILRLNRLGNSIVHLVLTTAATPPRHVTSTAHAQLTP